MQNEKKRNVDIDILKGIGIVSVVIGHACNTDIFFDSNIDMIRRFVYTYHLSIFFFCTGYLLKDFSIKHIIKYVLRQYKFLVLICMSSFLLVPFWKTCGMLDDINKLVILKKIFHIILYQYDGFFVGAMWFVQFIMVTVVVYSLIGMTLINKNEYIFMTICVLTGLIGVGLVLKYGIGKEYVFIALLEVPIVFLGRMYKRHEINVENTRLTIFLFILLLLLMVLLNLNGKEYQIELSKGLIYGGGWILSSNSDRNSLLYAVKRYYKKEYKISENVFIAWEKQCVCNGISLHII